VKKKKKTLSLRKITLTEFHLVMIMAIEKSGVLQMKLPQSKIETCKGKFTKT